MLISQLDENIAFELIDLTRRHKLNAIGMKLLELRLILRNIISQIDKLDKKNILKYKIITRLELERLRVHIQKMNTLLDTASPRQMTVPELFYLAKRIKLFIDKYSISIDKLAKYKY
ncbi:hypothetical protein K9M79_05960 [Candidatus Woesearchaeota archaeon]|nr:hypothetical protein [Candidatus Woesearchaeota archaeon]